MCSLQHRVAGGGWDEMRNLCPVKKRMLLKGRSGEMTSRDPFQPELRWDPVDPGPAMQLTGCFVPYDNAGIRASRNP